MKSGSRKHLRRLRTMVLLAAVVSVTPMALAQTLPATRPVAGVSLSPELTGRPIEDVRIIGKTRTLPASLQAEIRHQVRTTASDKFDPASVEEDYRRIYDLKRFANVEARVEPTAAGVIVIFEVTEQSQIKEIRFRGNEAIDTHTLENAVDVRVGESMDPFRLATAREAVERLYHARNYPYVHVETPADDLAKGIVTLNVVEGPRVYVRKLQFLGNHSFTDDKLKDQIKTRAWFPIFVPGTYDADEVEQDVGAIRQFYQQHGFFDARVGRKIVVSPDQTEVMVSFVIDEGRRYMVERISFKGNSRVTEAQLRENLKLVEGRPYDYDIAQRDIRQMVKAYSPLGFIYLPQSNNPEYLRIEAKPVFRREAGKVELVYQISEGKPFHLGRIIVKGNEKTQDKVILREMKVAPGQLYNAGELADATDRLKATRLFDSVVMTPIGADPDVRDVLVDVSEGQTGRFLIGAGVTSNMGVLGNISYEQWNFDIANWPSSGSDLTRGRAFTGAGQYFRVLVEPGTEVTRAQVDFQEPWILDQPYSFGTSLYLSNWDRDDYFEERLGAKVSLGKRFDDVWSSKLTLRGEDVRIYDIHDKRLRAPEILEYNGYSTLTSAALELKRDTSDNPLLPSRGTTTSLGWEHAGALGGDFDFDKLTGSWTGFLTVGEDLLDRKTILTTKLESGYIPSGAPFFERFYGGGIGSVRGFKYRGISPRSGLDDDAIGGDFSVDATMELSFPLIGDSFRGVVFADAGTVDRDVRLGTVRSSVGLGIRWTVPFLGQLPLALDFGFPVTKNSQDDTQIFSFSMGLTH